MEVARRIAEVLSRAPSETPQLRALSPAPPPARAVAVDGSHVVLAESGDHLLAAFRAGFVGVEKGEPMTPRVPPPEVAYLGPEGPGGAKAALERARTAAEARAALEAVATMGEGDLLLIDGALRAQPTLDEMLGEAKARGVDVVGVCKSTSLTLGGVPALVACQLAGRAQGARTWVASLPTPAYVRGASFAAKLSPAEERVFRFDVAGGDPAVLARVAGLCGHPAYPGYPSPLAMAHNAVLLNDDARRRILAQVQEAAIAAGADPRAWDAAFVDYHDVLELGA
jgi:hypothetical protein